MTRLPDVHLRSDGTIDIDHYRREAARERAEALRLAHGHIDAALASIIRAAKDLLSRRPALRPGIPSAASR